MESTAVNRDPLCHIAGKPLRSIRIHCTTLHGIHCIQSRSIGPRCMESTAFNRDPLDHAAWNTLHSCKYASIYSGLIIEMDFLCHQSCTLLVLIESEIEKK